MVRNASVDGPLLADRYRVIRRLGAGGMAAVYLAHDERLDRDVAVKRMHTAERDDIDARRFEREAKLGASLSHPNLVSIFDTEQDDESVLLVMEYVEGETLADVLARGEVEPRRAIEIVRAVAEALDHAHSAGIVHRDIKPANVLLGRDGSVKLADLGIAKAVERTDITGTGTVLGTPGVHGPGAAAGRRPRPGGRRLRARDDGVRDAHRPQGTPWPQRGRDRPSGRERAAARPARGQPRDPRPGRRGAPRGDGEGSRRQAADGGRAGRPARAVLRPHATSTAR